jgi:hypothetical protein
VLADDIVKGHLTKLSKRIGGLQISPSSILQLGGCCYIGLIMISLGLRMLALDRNHDSYRKGAALKYN